MNLPFWAPFTVGLAIDLAFVWSWWKPYFTIGFPLLICRIAVPADFLPELFFNEMAEPRCIDERSGFIVRSASQKDAFFREPYLGLHRSATMHGSIRYVALRHEVVVTGLLNWTLLGFLLAAMHFVPFMGLVGLLAFVAVLTMMYLNAVWRLKLLAASLKSLLAKATPLAPVPLP